MICADCNPAIRLYEENGYQRVKEFSHWYVTSDEKKNQKTALEEKTEI